MGAKVIAAALATTLPNAAEIIKGVAEETLRDVLQDILGVPPEASVTAEQIDEAEDAGTEAGRAKPAASAGAVSLVGLVVLGLFAIAYYAINRSTKLASGTKQSKPFSRELWSMQKPSTNLSLTSSTRDPSS
jgi:hypothetical protein